MGNGSNITTINVENIPCYCSIGIHDEEKKMGQRLFVSLNVSIESSKVAQTDNVSDTLNYVDLYNIVQNTGKLKSHNLIECLGEKIANQILKIDLVKNVKVKIRKPHIPFEEFSGEVSIELQRSK